MRIEWITGPRETRFGELKPGEFYELPDEEAWKLIASGLAKRADMRAYPERAARCPLRTGGRERRPLQ